MPDIHPTAIVAKSANLSSSCTIKAYCVIDGDVTIGDDCVIGSHAVISGDTELGSGCKVFPFASIGSVPQDLKFSGEASKVIIGANNVFREGVTVNSGTKDGGSLTSIGDNCLFMINSHIAHDCHIGDRVILANGVALGGHCHIGNSAIVGGNSAVHQFVRIGEQAFIGGMTGVERDVVPFAMAIGDRAGLAGLNLVGLRRAKHDRNDIKALQQVYNKLFNGESSLSLQENAKSLRQDYKEYVLASKLLDFVTSDSKRSFCLP